MLFYFSHLNSILGKSRNKPLSEYLDSELIKGVIETGEDRFYEEIYNRYADKVYGKCILMVQDLTVAQDLAQDILIKAFMKLYTFKGHSTFGTWLFQISYTHCIDYLRKHKKIHTQKLEDENTNYLDSNSTTFDEISLDELFETKLEYVKKIIHELKAEEKSMVLMKYMDNMTVKELAKMFNTTESAIKMRLLRTRDKIKRRYYKIHNVD